MQHMKSGINDTVFCHILINIKIRKRVNDFFSLKKINL